MKTTIEVTEITKTTKNIEVEFPMFVDGNSEKIKIISKDLFLRVYRSDDNTCASISTYDSDATNYIANGTPISEEEFNKYFSEALQIIYYNLNK